MSINKEFEIVNHCNVCARRQTTDRPETEARTINSFSTRLLSCCTDDYAHMYNISTYSVSSNRVSDSSSELRCL